METHSGLLLSYLFTLSSLSFQLFSESLLFLGIGCFLLFLFILQCSHLSLELIHVLVQEDPEEKQCTAGHSVDCHTLQAIPRPKFWASTREFVVSAE